MAKGGPLKWFAIAGADKRFVWADAKIERDTVIVSSPQVRRRRRCVRLGRQSRRLQSL